MAFSNSAERSILTFATDYTANEMSARVEYIQATVV